MVQMLNRESFQSFESYRNQMLAKMGREKGSTRANRPSRADEAGSPQHPSSSATDSESCFYRKISFSIILIFSESNF